MKIPVSISNIAWSPELNETIYQMLVDQGVTAIEIAPTKFGRWDELNGAMLAEQKRRIQAYGLQVSSYQALYFGVPDAQLLGSAEDFERMLNHTVKFFELSRYLSDGGVAVFGAPKNRLRGPKSAKAAFDLGVERLSQLADAAYSVGLVLALEPAPAVYGGDFLQTANDCASMVNAVDHPGLRMHLDTGCTILSDEDPVKIIELYHEIICHVHISKPFLEPLDETAINLAKLRKALESICYEGYVAIEMRETENALESVANASKVVISEFAHYEVSNDNKNR